jgi:CHASE3 domain sensor protein
MVASPLRLRAKVALAVAAGALVVAGGIGVLLGNTISMRSRADTTIQLDRYLLRTVEIERLIVDAETGLRGYLVADAPVFLAPLRTASAHLPAAEAALTQSATSMRLFARQARTLNAAAHAYMNEYVPGLLHIAATNLAAARSFIATQAGKTLVDRIRSQTETLERLLSARQTAGVHDAHHSADVAIADAIAALVVLTGLTLLLGGWLGHLAVTRERAREEAERTTRTLQLSILPARLPEVPGCEIAVRFRPAGGGLVGGDFYDVYAVDGHRWAIVLGDVCGKGPAAAAVAAMARWTLRSLAGSDAGPERALRALNQTMLRQPAANRYLTLTYALLTLEDGSASLEVACAGHPAPVLVPARGHARSIEARGDLLGIWTDVRFSPREFELAPGSALVLYSDGVIEGGAGPTGDPVLRLSESAPGAGAEALAAKLAAMAPDPVDGQARDDVAVLALQYAPAKPAPVAAVSRTASGA